MNAATISTKTTTIVLTEIETNWLKGLMQNPISARYPENESPQDKEMRKVFFSALSEKRNPRKKSFLGNI